MQRTRDNPVMPTPRFSVTVQCRVCEAEYEKPDARSTVRANPGCPECGALGWMPVYAEVMALAAAPHRSGGDPQPLPHGRAG
jgi:hypothetical protein